MKKVLVAVAATVFTGIPAMADCTVTQINSETIKTQPAVQENIISSPELAATCTTTVIQKKDTAMVPNYRPSVFVVNPSPALLASNGVVIEVVNPDDLIYRQAELNARILVEQAAGTITTAEANDLLNRLGNVAGVENGMKAEGTLTWKQVEHTYRAFDRIAHDLDNYSSVGGNRLAGSFIVL
ncbi:MAG TPA: hypothetical protein V6C81_08000 [Planktothrix sp.]